LAELIFLAGSNFIMLAYLRFTACLSAVLAAMHARASEPARPMSTDRPDTTESPYTVPAGMFQIEASFFDYSRDSADGNRLREWSWSEINFKAGLARDVDLQVILSAWNESVLTRRGGSERLSGVSDVTVRLKTNLLGNDEGRSAFGLMPYVTIPSGSGVSADAWQGGLIAPFAFEVNDRVSLGLMAEADLVYDEDTGGHDLEWLHSATVGIALTEPLGMYLELVGIAGEDTNYQGIFNAGLTFAVSDDLVFDAWCRLRLNRPAPDFGVFTGVSFRF